MAQLRDDEVKQRLKEEDPDFVDPQHVPAAEAVLRKVLRNRDRKLRYLRGKPQFFHWAYRIVTSAWFDSVVIAIVIGNTVTLSIDYYGIPDDTTEKLTIANIVFSSLFGLELALKIVALGYRAYLSSYSNCFDALIVFTSFLEIGLGGGTGSTSVLRTFRLLRVLKLAKSIKSLRSVQCVQCAVCSVQCAVCSVQCAVCSVQCAVCSVQCACLQCVTAASRMGF
jgi:hypothetical protein